VLFLGCGVAFAPVMEALVSPGDKRPMHWLAVAGILFVAVLSNLTAVGRLHSLLRALAPAHHRQQREPWVFLALHAVAGAVATGVDFGIYRGVVDGAGLGAASATVVGCLVGAVVNYSLNRMFTFRSKGAVTPQFARYALVSGVSAALNASGVALLLLLPDMNSSVGWWLARAAVYLAWNFPAHRDYVFAEPAWSEKLTAPVHAA
ncbi:MAG TPA: GtrA family protein, partial [Myxococcaceae bacterium]|nr:GtrA family protein [Myxococcaceae bacterium]